MKASHLALWVNEALGLIEEDFYSTRTVITWLHKCGFKVKQDISSDQGVGELRHISCFLSWALLTPCKNLFIQFY